MHARTSPLPPIALADPVWTIEHVALAFRIGIRSSRSLVASPGFPTPFRLNASRTARLYWRREDVLAHLARASDPTTPLRSETPPKANTSPTPTTSTRMPRAAITSSDLASDDAALAAIAALPRGRGAS